MKKIVSNVAGQLTACHIEVGARVAAGDEVFTVASMKMDIPVESEWSGQVVEVLVKVGDDIDEGQALASLQ